MSIHVCHPPPTFPRCRETLLRVGRSGHFDAPPSAAGALLAAITDSVAAGAGGEGAGGLGGVWAGVARAAAAGAARLIMSLAAGAERG